jgi:superfamily I DNA/RNA helicase
VKHYRISRYNDSIIKDSINKAFSGKSIYIEGGLSSIDFSYFKEVYDFAFFNKRSKRLSRFKDLAHLKAYARKTKDINSLRALKLIGEYGFSFNEKIKIMQSKLVDKEYLADVCYTTAHKSKGKTISMPVIVDDDFCNAMEDNPNITDIDQEINVLHVACTRCNNTIVLPNFLYEMLENHVDEEDCLEEDDDWLCWGEEDSAEEEYSEEFEDKALEMLNYDWS